VTIREATLLFQIFIISTLAELTQEIRDYEVDKKGEENTTAVYIGLKNTKIVYTILVLLFSLVTPILVNNAYLRYLSLALAPIYFLTQQNTIDQRAMIIFLSYTLSAIIFLS
jgi:1,4-dihydroxy-2-naphthoate octaprenyltransferase